jgi:Mrp family chromosome partitioning ATPase
LACRYDRRNDLEEHMPVIVVANPKGGVGKSTLATDLAGWCAAARGLTLWDTAPSRVERDLEQWQAVLTWADR